MIRGMTTAREEFAFEADSWSVEWGRLSITKGSGTYRECVALFSRGDWLFVALDPNPATTDRSLTVTIKDDFSPVPLAHVINAQDCAVDPDDSSLYIRSELGFTIFQVAKDYWMRVYNSDPVHKFDSNAVRAGDWSK